MSYSPCRLFGGWGGRRGGPGLDLPASSVPAGSVWSRTSAQAPIAHEIEAFLSPGRSILDGAGNRPSQRQRGVRAGLQRAPAGSSGPDSRATLERSAFGRGDSLPGLTSMRRNEREAAPKPAGGAAEADTNVTILPGSRPRPDNQAADNHPTHDQSRSQMGRDGNGELPGRCARQRDHGHDLG
jgi:hypothetical protein